MLPKLPVLNRTSFRTYNQFLTISLISQNRYARTLITICPVLPEHSLLCIINRMNRTPPKLLVFSSYNLRPFNLRTAVNRIDVGSLDGSFLWFMCMKLCFLLGMDHHRLVIDLFDFQFSHLLSNANKKAAMKMYSP